MRFFAALPLLASSYTFAQIQISQNPLTGDCRLSPDSLRPIVPPLWPYMYRYEWDPRTKTETLYLSPQKQLRIEQRACNRHHITYELRVPLNYPLAPASPKVWYTSWILSSPASTKTTPTSSLSKTSCFPAS
jgi:hypothetical protein